MKKKILILRLPLSRSRAALLMALSLLLSGCATWTGTVDRTATTEELETVPLTQKLVSSGFEMEIPDGWVAVDISQAQQAENMVGLFKHPEKDATVAVYKPKVMTVKRVRAEVDRLAEVRLPGAELSDGPFSLGSSAMSPMYIRYAGVSYKNGELVNRLAYGGFNLARMFFHHVMVMEVGEAHTDWSKRQFISMMKGF